MGAETFFTKARGKSAQEAFDEAVRRAQYDYGHAGYTGTIAEKSSFVEFPNIPEGQTPRQYAAALINECHPDVDNKWGPAGCVKSGEDEYLFFGWASC